MELFMISLGGKVPGGNLEVHDLQFMAADQTGLAIGGWTRGKGVSFL